MFTPKLNSSRGRFTPLHTPNTPNTSLARTPRRTSNLTPQKRNAAGTPLWNHSLNSSTLRSNDDGPQHTLEEFSEADLPLVITETLALDGREAEVRFNPDGWAWLVSGRKVLIWRSQNDHVGKACYELVLPSSEVSPLADCISLSVSQDVVSCIACTAEGSVRYWPNVTQKTNSGDVELNASDRCVSVVALDGPKWLVATETTSIYVLTPHQNQASIVSRALCMPQGMLSGIGRRMSSFIFGAAQQQQPVLTRLHRVLPGEVDNDSGAQAFYVLTGSSLQKWSVFSDTERMVYEVNVEQWLRERLAKEVWGEVVNRLPKLQTWVIDMHVSSDGILILGAGMNSDVSQQLSYALGTLSTEGNSPPGSFLAFSVPKYASAYQEDEHDALLSFRLLCPQRSSAFLHSRNQVLCLSVNGSSQPVDKVEFSSPGDGILGFGVIGTQVIFLSDKFGMVTIRQEGLASQTNITASESFLDTSVKIDTCLASAGERLEDLSLSEDEMSRFKAAFLHASRGNMSQAQALIQDLFHPALPPSDDVNSALDSLVARLSQEMIDDFPASDPRWAESVAPHDGASSTASLILLHQLEDKLKAHTLYTKFLHLVDIWPRLGSVTVRDAPMACRLLLQEHAEKIVAARGLRMQHADHAEFVDSCIEKVLQQREQTKQPRDGLTHQDIFYREVSRVDDILRLMQVHEEESLFGDLTPAEIVELISSTNSILCSMLYEVSQFRLKHQLDFALKGEGQREPEHISWTASEGPGGMRGLLARQHALTVSNALPEAQDSHQRQQLIEQLLHLTDAILDGFRLQLDLVKQGGGQNVRYLELIRQYEAQRTQLLAPFLELKQHERAASLAEKYCDFGTLVQLCEETDDHEKLSKYMEQFGNRGFSDFVFKWYVDEGKRGKLLSCDRLSQMPQLGRFLQTNEHRYMSWLHNIPMGNFLQAHTTLFDLAKEEQKTFAKKKTLLSLSKLTAYACEDPPDIIANNWEEILHEQTLMLHQEQLPQSVLEGLALDVEKFRVFSAEELIDLFTGSLNANANEFDFKKALDLLNFLPKDSRADFDRLLLMIWNRSILMDNWTDLDLKEADTVFKKTVFFSTVELAIAEDMDLATRLPTLDRILSSDDLQNLSSDKTFLFLIRAAYEQIQRMMAD